MDSRREPMQHWLTIHCKLPDATCELMAGDASFRRYFRVRSATAQFVLMDAPPDRETGTRAFIALAHALRCAGLQVPQVYASDLEQGFLLLTDLGDRLYLRELTDANADALYARALAALAVLQQSPVTTWSVPPFTADFMVRELVLCQEWFLEKHLGLTIAPDAAVMLQTFYHRLATTAASQPQVLMHRDYHAANLLVLPDDQVGILDFQDAFIGPVTYDLASLLRDCYIAWPEARVTAWALSYKAQLAALASVSDADFLRWFDLMCLQRHLKALLTFARKWHRDANPHYLQHVPRTLQYLATVSARHPEARDFHAWLTDVVLPVAQQVVTPCVQ